MSECLLVCTVRPGPCGVRGGSQSQARVYNVLTNERRDASVGQGPVISVARPSEAKTRRLQNICATHPQPALTGRGGERRRETETFLGLGNF